MIAWRTGPFLCSGEPLIVLTPEDGSNLECARALSVSVGGAELNVAIHLARLGIPVRYAGGIGDDPFGRRIRAVLEREGVDVSGLQVDARRPTGFYLKEPAQTGRAVYYYRRGSAAAALRRLPETALDGVAHVHTTGVLAGISRAGRELVRRLVVDRDSWTVSFDLNYRRALWPRSKAAPVLLAIAQRADIVFVGLDEARALWGVRDAEAVRLLLPQPSELVVTDGPRAAVGFTADAGPVAESPPPVDVVEPTGAGDAFAAGYLATRRDGGDVRTALRVGHALASEVLQVLSDHGPPPDPRLLASARAGGSIEELARRDR